MWFPHLSTAPLGGRSDPNVKEAHDFLEFMAHALDRVAQILQSNSATQYEGKLAEQCQELVIHTQHTLRASHPELQPPWESYTDGLGDEWREYARRLIAGRDLWAAGRYHDVIEVWREYLTHDPPYFYSHLGEHLLQHLEKLVQEVTAPPNSR